MTSSEMVMVVGVESKDHNSSCSCFSFSWGSARAELVIISKYPFYKKKTHCSGTLYAGKDRDLKTFVVLVQPCHFSNYWNF